MDNPSNEKKNISANWIALLDYGTNIQKGFIYVRPWDIEGSGGLMLNKGS